VENAPSRNPAIVSGSPDAVAERLLGFVRLGFTAMNFHPVGPRTQEQLERLQSLVK